MLALYLDECVSDAEVARQLRLAGFSVFRAIDLGNGGLADPPQLEAATALQALLVTANTRHFVPLHRAWREQGQSHGGILVSPQEEDVGFWVTRLERVARLLSTELARNQLLDIHLFSSEESATAYAESLRPLAS